MLRRLLRTVVLAELVLLVLYPAAALAADTVPPPQPTLALPSLQLYALLIGGLVPLATYAANHFAPWASEPVKALFLVVIAAVAGALTQLVDTGTLALNVRTLEIVATAVAGALAAHAGLWRPAGINARLGGGTNRA